MMIRPISVFLDSNQTTTNFDPLVVCVCRICGRSMHENLSTDPNNVSFLATVLNTKGTNA